MKPLAALALAGVVYVVNRRRLRSATRTEQNLPPAPPAPRYVSATISQSGANNGKAVLAGQSYPSEPSSQSASKPILGAVLQWIFLILLGAALSLTAVKGNWDVFAILMTAASVQLGCQMVRWLGGNGSGSGGRRGAARSGRSYRNGGGDKQPPRAARPDPRLGGVWVKDASRSDSMDEATAAMKLNGLVRTAVRLVRGMELDPAALRAGRFDMAVFSVIAWFKVRESYLLDGTVGYYNRRDLRRGKHAASVCVQPDGSVLLSVSWGQPLAGSGTDHFVLVPAASAASAAPPAAAATSTEGTPASAAEPSEEDLLVVTSTIQLAAPLAAGVPGASEGQEGALAAAAAAALPPPITYRTVYVRAGRGRRHRPQQQDQQIQEQQQ